MAIGRRNQDQYMLRLPDGLRDEIKAAADANSRSMNSEIVARLSGDTETLRDKFAGRALAGLLAADSECGFKPEGAAESAYKMADAMLAARKAGAA